MCVSVAAYSSSIQKCSIAASNAADAPQRASEQTAARAKGVRYIDVVPWTCSAECTVVIGNAPMPGTATGTLNMGVHYSSGHLSETYDLYLTGVLKAALAPALK
jgi:hypothetical protein